MVDDSGMHPSEAPPYGLDPEERYRLSSSPVDGVCSGRDVLLDRPVSLRLAAADAVPELEREGRFLARLDQSGIPALHDIVRHGDGAMLVQRTVDGVNLEQAVIASLAGELHPAIADPARCALTIARVCDILDSAHRRQVVHRGVTPARIILAGPGEVLLDGWRLAMESIERPATLRFVANPESLPPPLDGLADDLRGAATCLYLAVVRELPPQTGDGALASLPIATQQLLPQGLEAIVRRALAAGTGSGYASAAALAEDLRRYATGRAVEAAPRDPFSRTLLWIDRERRPLLAALLALAVAAGFTASLWGGRIRDYATWGPAQVVERFDQAGWLERWQPVVQGSWEVKDGRLVTCAPLEAMCIYRRLLTPPVAIEYTGRIPITGRQGDLSVWWCEDPQVLGNPGLDLAKAQGVLLQAGAYENSLACIVKLPGNQRGAVANLRLEPGVDHRFRVEIGNGSYRLWVDGRLVADWNDIIPPGSGHIGLYGYFPGMSFDDVTIWEQPMAALVSPLAIGDAAFRDGRFDLAARLYEGIALAHGGRELGEEALFRKGLAERQGGDRVRAAATWGRLADGPVRQRAECLRIDDLVALGQDDLALEALGHQWRDRPHLRQELSQRWQVGMVALNRPQTPVARLDAWLRLRASLFPDDVASAKMAAQVLLGLDRPEAVLAGFPDEARSVGFARLMLGRGDAVLSDQRSSWLERGRAHYQRGELEAIAEEPLHYDYYRALALSKLGRFDEALAVPHGAGIALILSGQADRVLDHPRELGFSLRTPAMIALGRTAELAQKDTPTSDWRVLLLRGEIDRAQAVTREDLSLHPLLAALKTGDRERALALRPAAAPSSNMNANFRWVVGTIGLPLADEALGATGALRRSLERAAELPATAWGGIPRAVARAALSADDDDGIERLPWRTEAKAWRLVAKALRGELAGDRKAASAAWQAFLALPQVDRTLDDLMPNLHLEAIAGWRGAGD